MGLGNAPHKVMACSIGDGRSSEGSILCSWDFGKLWLNSEGGMSQEGTQAWKSTQPDCCLGHSIIYLFSQVHRIELTNAPQFLAQLYHH